MNLPELLLGSLHVNILMSEHVLYGLGLEFQASEQLQNVITLQTSYYCDCDCDCGCMMTVLGGWHPAVIQQRS